MVETVSLTRLAEPICLEMVESPFHRGVGRRGTSISEDQAQYVTLLGLSGMMAPDVAFYTKHHHPARGDLFNRLGLSDIGAQTLRGLNEARSSDVRLQAQAEADFLRWRAQGDSAVVPASMGVLAGICTAYIELMDRAARVIAERGYEDFPRSGGAYLKSVPGFWYQFHALKRSMVRAYSDLQFMAPERLRVMVRNYERLTKTPAGRGDTCAKRSGRPALKRSIRLLEQLLGRERVRAFMSSGDLRVEGKHWDYLFEMRDLWDSGHGSCDLSLLTKHAGTTITGLCIYTPDVPVLDHVASIVMHVQADAEDEILRIGNLMHSDEEAIKQFPELHRRHWSYPSQNDDLIIAEFETLGPTLRVSEERPLPDNAQREVILLSQEDIENCQTIPFGMAIHYAAFIKIRAGLDAYLRGIMPELTQLKQRVRELTQGGPRPPDVLAHILHRA